MCYNCGCDLPNDPMGKGKIEDGGGSLVESSFEHMAKIWEMSVEDTKKEVYKLLKKELEGK
jgi:hypothetical protein